MTAIGYPDFRRQQDWNSSSLLDDLEAQAFVGNTTRGPFNVGNFGYLAGIVPAVNQPIFVTIKWWLDSAGFTLLGIRDFVIDPNGPVTCQFRVPNMGRFVTVSYSAGGLTNFTITSRLWGSSVPFPAVMTPVVSDVAGMFPVGLGAGLSTVAFFTDYASGAAVAACSTGGQPGQFLIQVQRPVGTWSDVWVKRVPANSDDSGLLTLPVGVCRIRVLNTGAAADNYVFNVTSEALAS